MDPASKTAYNPKEIEDKWARFWEEKALFRADPTSHKPSFSLVMPPPNVTGVLHMGHALVNTLQDILVRWKRMSGYEVLWVPGTDHAGIATQTVVERHLIATENKQRKEFSREAFLEHVWAWKEKSEKEILSQLKRLGCSCDWSRLAFSMDEPRAQAVRTCFKQMYDKGLIYRGDYLVNWDPHTETALADDEVEYEERAGFLYYIRYPLEGSEEKVTVATTRPETLLGDTAVAVNPKDARYQNLIGRKVVLPITERKVPIIADRFVEPTFGTGVVKITPAHDPNDYEMAHRHNLEMINIMTPSGKVNERGAEFSGLSMKEARDAIVKKLQSLGLIEKIVPHTHRVGVSYRSKADIEPFLSKQWFVKASAFKEKLISVVTTGELKLIPENWQSSYFHWIEGLRDWCISRQLWWGHRIPIWYNKEDPAETLCYAGEGLPPQVEKEPEKWEQDPDVLDTWFSAGLWPCSVFRWPDKTAEMAKFFPTSTLITGHDILFFWVARMVMMSEFLFGIPPFKETFLHGLIYAKSYWRFTSDNKLQYITGAERTSYELGAPLPKGVEYKWEKMSKSKGNIINPLEIIDNYGTDALRMTLAASATQAKQIDLDLRRFEEFKQFANKIFNGARFVFMHLAELTPDALRRGIDLDRLTLEDRWILSQLSRTIEKTGTHLANYAFDAAAHLTYTFFWKEFCAYYVELCKPILFNKAKTPPDKENKQKLLFILLSTSLRLIHPIAPFITEELFSQLKASFPSCLPCEGCDAYTRECLIALQAPACALAPFPTLINPQDIDEKVEAEFAFIDKVLHTLRTIRAEMQLPPSAATSLYLSTRDKSQLALLEENQTMLTAMVRLKELFFNQPPPAGITAEALVDGIKIVVPLPEEMKEKERERLEKEKTKLLAQKTRIAEQVSNREFIEKAPPHLVETLRTNLSNLEKALDETTKNLLSLSP